MREKRLAIVVVAAMLVGYVGVVVLGMLAGAGGLRWSLWPAPHARQWQVASLEQLPEPQRQLVAYGKLLFNETPVYAPGYVGGRTACGSCHVQGGIAPQGLPVVGSARRFPMFSLRARRNITLEDRIQECMTRSENGRALPAQSLEMRALLAYLGWLAEPHTAEEPFAGHGLALLPPLRPDVPHGAQVYAAQCAGCHGDDGAGKRRPYPPLWGADAFNDGAGMNKPEKMAAFVYVNMPQNRPGVLSPQDAVDVAAFIHQQPRPAYNHANDGY
ncbi:MAG: c-type cytochrome [Acidobacteriota bacterium]|nr:c-type cytochrome [Acidobacteriota bacterium]